MKISINENILFSLRHEKLMNLLPTFENCKKTFDFYSVLVWASDAWRFHDCRRMILLSKWRKAASFPWTVVVNMLRAVHEAFVTNGKLYLCLSS